MPTHEEVMAIVDELLPDVTKLLRVRCEHLLASGLINLEDFPAPYGLPKTLLVAAANEIIEQYDKPFPDRKHKRLLRKLKLSL